MANYRKFLYVTLPDGKVENRKTDAAYTHVVALLIRYADGSEHWTALQWSKSEANAVKATKSAWWAKNLGREDRGQTWLEFRVVPVDKKEDISGDIVNPSTQDDFDTGLVYDQPQPAVNALNKTTGLMYAQNVPMPALVGEIIPDKPDAWVEQIGQGLLIEVAKIRYGVTDEKRILEILDIAHRPTLPTFGAIEDIAFKHVNSNETGMVYDQPQPFTFDFKRGDVVEFLFAFPRTPAHKGWLKGIFYNVYPGDSRYACIRREGIYEAARLADIRKPLPVVTDIFDGMGDFEVKASSSAKAA